MPEETSSERDAPVGPAPAHIGVLEVVRVPGTAYWTVRVTVSHADGPVSGWTPLLFGDVDEAERVGPAAELREPGLGTLCQFDLVSC